MRVLAVWVEPLTEVEEVVRVLEVEVGSLFLHIQIKILARVRSSAQLYAAKVNNRTAK